MPNMTTGAPAEKMAGKQENGTNIGIRGAICLFFGHVLFFSYSKGGPKAMSFLFVFLSLARGQGRNSWVIRALQAQDPQKRRKAGGPDTVAAVEIAVRKSIVLEFFFAD